MLFLVTLLLPSMLTEGRVLTQTGKETTMSADHKTNHKADLEKNDSQGERNTQEAFEMILCAFNQEKMLLKDQANSGQHELKLSKFFTALSKCGAQNYQVDTVNYRIIPHIYPLHSPK
ncbi:exocrine gland-secreting peptide 4 precursor [Mus musculus]|uniref:Exocrine gland secreted peptide 4 n=1 Tax=Mus musculus TaxID=10090 RepID=A8R0T8_MOUSE|nr:exocrine gland-secreting peptide 4 precursor [Mus musculus]BAF92721.1 exocrine gland-secreting peptide 4 [Mus musculus]|eukprot:NP_001171054.1 exocrine gland-secreting peptide 4 precursor [Mus musculus]